MVQTTHILSEVHVFIYSMAGAAAEATSEASRGEGPLRLRLLVCACFHAVLVGHYDRGMYHYYYAYTI